MSMSSITALIPTQARIASFGKTEIAGRYNTLLSVVDILVKGLLSTVGATASAITSVASLGLDEKRVTSTYNDLFITSRVGPEIFQKVLQLIYTGTGDLFFETNDILWDSYQLDLGSRKIQEVAQYLNLIDQDLSKTDNSFFVSRGKFLTLAISAIGTRVFYNFRYCHAIPVALIRTTISVFKPLVSDKGECEEFSENTARWNQSASETLFGPAIISDLFACTIGFLNPSAGKNLLGLYYLHAEEIQKQNN